MRRRSARLQLTRVRPKRFESGASETRRTQGGTGSHALGLQALLLGFPLRGDAIGVNLYGSMTSPATMGGYGAGTTIWWTDPERDLTFVGLMTGVMNADANYVRWRRLSDIAVSAAT